MSTLDLDQQAIAATLLHGPDHCPAHLFEGDETRVMRGLRVHANTISHARLVALEESFPVTLAYLGAAEFNRLSREFLEAGGARGHGVSDIGHGFADWLAGAAGMLAGDVARIEWAWLEAYHAADAAALSLSDLAATSEADLLAMPVRVHPAVRLIELRSDAAPLLGEGLASGTGILLIVRPEAEVRILATGLLEAMLIGAAKKTQCIGNLVTLLPECPEDGGAAIAALIGAGVFEKV